MNITLIGMSGVGKSTVGRKLAQKLGFAYIDTDVILQEQSGTALQKLLDTKGEKEFLALESKIITSIGAIDNTVVAPGGSIVYLPDALTFVKDNSMVVHLRGTLEVLKERNNVSTRGIVGLRDKTYDELYHERMALYNQHADTTIDIGRDTPEEIVEKIRRAINVS